MTGVDVTLNGVSLGSAVPQLRVREINRGLLGEPRSVSTEIPGRAGAWSFAEEPGDRMIRIEGILVADGTAARRAAMSALADWANTTGTAVLEFSDETDRYHIVTLDTPGDVNDALRYGEVELEWRAYPYALAQTVSTHTEAVSGAGSDSGTFSITDVVTAEPVIEITPTNGTILSFTLTVNGKTISWSGTLADDATITISSLADVVTLGASGDVNLTGAFDPDDVSMATVTASGFPRLRTGSNSWSIEWTGTATTIDLDFTWRERLT